jgi:hypothetical protein
MNKQINFLIKTPNDNPNTAPMILPEGWKVKPTMTDIRKPYTYIDCKFEPELPRWLKWLDRLATDK